jgi:hypothetical protein
MTRIRLLFQSSERTVFKGQLDEPSYSKLRAVR